MPGAMQRADAYSTPPGKRAAQWLRAQQHGVRCADACGNPIVANRRRSSPIGGALRGPPFAEPPDRLPEIATTCYRVRSYNRRHQPLPSQMPG
ncbi:hypothetical protein [Burkholderia diffusa]|uniref:hypothetical protein n=1 Tax=Burkholderia diffusa TaxID=488732 RepID=UPI00158F35E6|nr:hypothetical protein [Burkholderia diffusa]